MAKVEICSMNICLHFICVVVSFFTKDKNMSLHFQEFLVSIVWFKEISTAVTRIIPVMSTKSSKFGNLKILEESTWLKSTL